MQKTALFLLLSFTQLLTPQLLTGRTPTEPVATFSRIGLVPDAVKFGVHGLEINFDIRLNLTGAQVNAPRGGNVAYGLSARLFDEAGVAMGASADAGRFRSATGQCRDSANVVQGPEERNIPAQTMFVPYYALGLEEGRRKLSVELHLRHIATGVLVGQSKRQDIYLEKPPVNLFRLQVHQLDVEGHDPNGETWDYGFLNPKEIGPDIRWSVRRGETFIFQSKKQKNDTTYRGNEEDNTGYFSVSQGDLISLHVRDFDLISFSDEIGTYEFSPGTPDIPMDHMVDRSFGQVVNARITLSKIEMPRMDLMRFELLEEEAEDGVTGVRLKFDYKLYHKAKGAKFYLDLREIVGEISYQPEMSRIITGPAVKEDDGRINLVSLQGQVNMFLPHYGLLAELPSGRRPLIRLKGYLMLDGQRFDLAFEQRQLLRPLHPVADLEFGQWKVQQDSFKGAHGLRISVDYALPKSYFEDLPKHAFRLAPIIRTFDGTIHGQDLFLLRPKGAQLDGGALVLTPGSTRGVLEVFLPMYLLSANQRKINLNVQYRAMMEGRTLTEIGNYDIRQELEIPELTGLHLRIRDVSVRKMSWLTNHPNLSWRIYIGPKLVYASSIAPTGRKAHWGQSEFSKMVISDKDIIRIEILHNAPKSRPTRMGLWTGTLSDLGMTENGLRQLKFDGVRKCVVEGIF